MTDQSTQCTVAAEERRLKDRISFLEHEVSCLQKDLDRSLQVFKDSLARQDLAHQQEVESLQQRISQLERSRSYQASLTGGPMAALDSALRASRDLHERLKARLDRIEDLVHREPTEVIDRLLRSSRAESAEVLVVLERIDRNLNTLLARGANPVPVPEVKECAYGHSEGSHGHFGCTDPGCYCKRFVEDR